MDLPHISLTKKDQAFLETFTRKGTHKSRELIRAEVLRLAAAGLSEETIASRTRRHTRTVRRIVARYQAGGLERALFDAPRPGQPRKTTKKDDAFLIALACTEAPEGRDHWTLELLEEAYKKKRKKVLGHNAIWLRLRAHDLKPWRKKNVVHTDHHA
jgi:transposase